MKGRKTIFCGDIGCYTLGNAMPLDMVDTWVLCAGCPHRASFYAVKAAMKGRKTIFCGDIGCYTLGNAMPLDMVDTCLCMGAGLGIAQGVGHIEPDTSCFAFVGDSRFFASAITGVINAVYNQANMTLIILDNSTTAMTIEPDTSCFAFVGDSRFFASAITGVINAVYNQANMTLIILDNSTTAMTRHQPHPGTGHTMMGKQQFLA